MNSVLLAGLNRATITKRWGWLGLLAVAAGLFFGTVLAFDRFDTIVGGVKVEGVPLSGLTETQARAVLSAALTPDMSRAMRLTYRGQQLVTTPEETGLRLNLTAAARAAYAVGRRGSLAARWRSWRVARQGGATLDVPTWFAPGPFRAFYSGLQNRFGVLPKDARWTAEPDGQISVLPSRDGRRLDRAELKAQVRAAAFQSGALRTVSLPFRDDPPHVSTAMARAAGVTGVVASFRTYFNPGDANRSGNIKLAAETLDQQFLPPGATFSFNKVVGPRLPTSGYREAPVVVEGKLVTGVGGGVCQVSSTIYNTALLAGLEITARSHHSIPAAYVPLGRDATVAYNYLDLAFKNNRARPVVLTVTAGPSWVEASILGTPVPGQEITLESQLVETIPPGVEDVADLGLPQGRSVVQRPGIPGYIVKVWRITKNVGAEPRREFLSLDRYDPVKTIMLVGGGPTSTRSQ